MPLSIRYGIAAGFFPMNLARTQTEVLFMLDKIQASGADFLRTDLLQSSAYQSRFNFVLTEAEARGLEMVAVLRGTSGPQSGGPSAAAAFASQMAQLFGSRVYIYEYVNEPNLNYLGGTVTRHYPSASVYGAELAAVYAAIKAVDSSYLVSTCGLGHDNTAGAVSGWWPGALAGGASGHFDIYNVHCYLNPGALTWTEPLTAGYNEGKPIIITEGGRKHGILAGDPSEGNEQDQANTVTAAMLDTQADAISLYTMMPDENQTDRVYAFLWPDHTEKLAFDAFRAIATSTSGGGGGTSGPGSHVQSISNWPTTSATTTTLTFTDPVAVNSGLVCFVAWNDAAVTCTVADNVNGAWSALSGPQTGTGELAAFRGQLFAVPNSASGGIVVTATFSSAVTRRGIAMAEYSGLLTSSFVDVTGSYKQQNSASPTSNTVVATQSDMLVSGCICGGAVTSVGSGFTLRANSGSGGTFGGNAYADQATAAGSFSSSWTAGAVHDNILAIAALKAGSVSAAATPFRSMVGIGA